LRARACRNSGAAKKIDGPGAIVKRSAMKIRHACVVLALLVSARARALAAPTEERRLVIVEAPGNLLTKSAREQLHKAVAEVATAQGLVMAPEGSLPARLQACLLPGCLPSIAAASGAIFVLRVEATFEHESFKLAVGLWNSDSGKLLGQDRRDCPICDEQDLWGSAALMTKALLDHALREPPNAVPAPPPPPAKTEVAPVPVAAPLPPAGTSEATGSSRMVGYSGLALSLAGVVAIGVGAFYMSVDGEKVGQDSGEVRDTMKYGLPMAIGGGVALLAGAGLVAWSFWPRSAKVAVGPSGVDVAWRF
jgi:hypothetical protein